MDAKQTTPVQALTDDTLSENYRRGAAKKQAAGLPAILHSLQHIQEQSGLLRGSLALKKLNQEGGFDCPSCAWPDPDSQRALTEFCENGAKAVASETTRRTIGAEFFQQYSIAELSQKSDHWHEQQGRLSQPMYRPAGASHYQAISWPEAFQHCADLLQSLPDPNQAVFYTSGRASNEAAFCYQLLARQYGTNNLPDCSNMCHESSGAALQSSIGTGKGTVSLDDFNHAEVIFVIGQNPGTNHPRMLSSLQKAARAGCKIIAINPLPEAGLMGFAHPQEVRGILGLGTPLASTHLAVKVNGDLPLLQGIAKAIFEKEEDRINHDFIAQHTQGFAAWKEYTLALSWSDIVEQSGISQHQIRQVASIAARSQASIFCWAMGLTQHHNSVAIIQQVVNLALLGGHLGKKGAGLCPVRGHSNVQGDRTMGIWEKMPDSFLDALDHEFSITSPRQHGYDTVQSIEAMLEHKVAFFLGLGGNFLSAAPDTLQTAQALSHCQLTAHISTKLNRSHLVTGQEALILPCLGRSEIDQQSSGPQYISTENSMSVVQKSTGSLAPVSPHLLSETAIICGIGQALLGNQPVAWHQLQQNYQHIRKHIAQVVPGCQDYQQRLQQPGGFCLPNSAKELDFSEIGGKAQFFITQHQPIALAPGQLLLMTLRSHDQYNTTIYGMDDRYRGIYGERRILLVHPADIKALGLQAEQPVNITSHFEKETRIAKNFLILPYSIPPGCAAAYFPEANVLVPLASKSPISNTPTSKSIVISLEAVTRSR